MRMDIFTEFLKTSSIHGLSYISSTRTHLKLAWTLIVFIGFTFAGQSCNDDSLKILKEGYVKN